MPHDVQTPPFAPHALFRFPAWQVPPVDAEQHPPLHAVLASQAVPQVCVVVLHAWLAGQSFALVQPQTVVVPIARQDLPAAAVAQLPQIVLPSAHCVGALPLTHWCCTLSQQPPLQGAVASHATPHAPAWHACPFGHAAQALPSWPHLARSLPATQLVPSQQPPLHGWFRLHAVPHLSVCTSHACSMGQSLAFVQPAAASPEPARSGPARSSGEPSPAVMSTASPALTLTDRTSQPDDSVLAALSADPIALPDDSATTTALTMRPAG